MMRMCVDGMLGGLLSFNCQDLRIDVGGYDCAQTVCLRLASSGMQCWDARERVRCRLWGGDGMRASPAAFVDTRRSEIAHER